MAAMQSLGATHGLYKSTCQVPLPSPGCRLWRSRPAVTRATCSSQQSAAAPAAPVSTLQKRVARPTTMATALTGFSVIAAGIFIPANRQASYLAESALRLLSSERMGAAQAATNQAAASASDPTVSHTVPSIMPAADPAAAMVSSPLLDLDQAVHAFVTSHTSVGFRTVAADIYISDVFITAGILGWLICSAMCLQAAPKKAARPLTLAWAFYFTTCGAYGDSDPGLVHFLKHVFARIRPSPMHHTFSFPSGHTSAAVFIVGALVTVLLPFTVQLLMQQQVNSSVSTAEQAATMQGQDAQVSSNSSSGSGSSSGSEEGSVVSAGSSEGFWRMYDVAAMSVWAAAWATTATGRVLADAHWVSDTLAGGCLAIATVSGLAWSYSFLQPEISSSGSNSNSNAV